MRSKVVDAWIEEGRVEERRRTLLQFATRRFGNSAFQASQIEQIEDAGRLERMLDAILDVNSWDELLNVV